MAHTVRRERAEEREWSVETNDSGHPQQVRTRTPREERQHQDRMDRWARRQGD